MIDFNNVDTISDIKDSSKSKLYLRQWVMTSTIGLSLVLIGMAHGYSAILFQQLDPKTANATQFVRIEEGEIFKKPLITVDSLSFQSWIASSFVLVMCSGCWVLSICNSRLGRKPILSLGVIVLMISFLIIALANNVNHILIGRCLGGLGAGIIAAVTTIYLGECSSPNLRTMQNATGAVAISIGIELSHAVGTWYHWRTTALFCSAVALITLLLIYYIPESPIWLLNRNKFRQAIHSWTFLRGVRDLNELKSMYIRKSLKESEQKKNKYFTPSFWKPLCIILLLFAVAQMSGMGAVTYYCIQMITEIAGADKSYIATLILDTFRLTFSVIVILASSRYSSRTLMLWSSSVCSALLILLSISILYKIYDPWFALVVLFAYEAAVVMGVSPMPFTFCGELFSSLHKEVGIGIVTNFNYLLFFSVVKFNPYLFILLKPWGGFLFYGIFTLFGSIVLYFIIPNTRNKSLKEIELIFLKK